MKIGPTPHVLLLSLLMDPQGPGQHTNAEHTRELQRTTGQLDHVQPRIQ